MSEGWPEPEGGYRSAWNIGRPLRDAEVEALGYKIQPNGSWKLVDPDARPAARKGMCRGCQKFEAMFSGICAGCAYFGLGDPHGLRAKEA